MTDLSLGKTPSRLMLRLGQSPLLAACLAALFFYAVSALQGFPTMVEIGLDNDSQMRLAQVRDLIGGQAWFDMHQYRMGGDGGFVMHWSRLVDAPIAAIMLVAGKLLGNQAAGETVAMVLWPALTFIAALYFIGRAAMRYAGPDALFPAIAIGATSLYTIGVFGPGCIDHHNVQITLTLAMLAFMLDSVDRPGFGLLSGAAAGLMLAVGMETVAYVAVGGLAISLWYLVKGEAAARQAANFGIGLAGSTLTAMLITRPISQWGSVECDALSGAQLAGACIAGIGLAAITSLPSLRNTSARRTFALAGLGVVLGAVVFAAFPQCVAKPYADMPPALRDYFMSGIAEAQSFVAVLKVAPASVFLYYPAALVATGWLGWRIWRNGAQLDDMIVAAFLVPATIVALYQLRGTNFATPIAIIPLAAMVAQQRRNLAEHPSLANNIRSIGAWLISFNILWVGAAVAVTSMIAPATDEDTVVGDPNVVEGCVTQADYGQLAALPATKVASGLNIGTSILMFTHHHPMAGLYHRNIDADVAALDLLQAQPAAAQAIAAQNKVGLIAVCPSDLETEKILKLAPNGLLAQIQDGAIPDWLTETPAPAASKLRIFTVNATR